ncbi:MAG: chloride channel protein [Oscillospiraceae bacterium]
MQKETFSHAIDNVKYFLKWSVISLITGAVGGAAGGLFYLAIAYVTSFRKAHGFMLYLMPIAGLIIVFLYKITKEEKNRGTNMILESISSDEKITVITGPLIFISSVLTHLVGGSAGREGAALQIGGSLGSGISRLLRLDEKDGKVAVMCGMSAVFSALFGTPVAAAVFSIEVISIGVMYYSALVPCLFSAFIGMQFAGFLGVMPEKFTIVNAPALSVKGMLLIILLGILCSVVSVMFCMALHGAEKLYKKFIPNAYIRILAASAIFILLTVISGTRLYNGSSMELITGSLSGSIGYGAFFLKIVFTAVCLGGGFKGGEIVPTLCVGASFGCAFGMLAGFSPSLCAACGMVALFVGVTNCPVASLMIALELFGGTNMSYFAIVIAVTFALSGYYGLYSSQKFAYSKTKAEFINRKSH